MFSTCIVVHGSIMVLPSAVGQCKTLKSIFDKTITACNITRNRISHSPQSLPCKSASSQDVVVASLAGLILAVMQTWHAYYALTIFNLMLSLVHNALKRGYILMLLVCDLHLTNPYVCWTQMYLNARKLCKMSTSLSTLQPTLQPTLTCVKLSQRVQCHNAHPCGKPGPSAAAGPHCTAAALQQLLHAGLRLKPALSAGCLCLLAGWQDPSGAAGPRLPSADPAWLRAQRMKPSSEHPVPAEQVGWSVQRRRAQ